jgi:hypothetical protein
MKDGELSTEERRCMCSFNRCVRKKYLHRARCRQEDNIKVDIKEIGVMMQNGFIWPGT